LPPCAARACLRPTDRPRDPDSTSLTAADDLLRRRPVALQVLFEASFDDGRTPRALSVERPRAAARNTRPAHKAISKGTTVHTIEAPPRRTFTYNPDALPQLGILDRIALRITLTLITRLEQHAGRAYERGRQARGDEFARTERERQAERLLLLTIPRR
jgi:hypothetical protein